MASTLKPKASKPSKRSQLVVQIRSVTLSQGYLRSTTIFCVSRSRSRDQRRELGRKNALCTYLQNVNSIISRCGFLNVLIRQHAASLFFV